MCSSYSARSHCKSFEFWTSFAAQVFYVLGFMYNARAKILFASLGSLSSRVLLLLLLGLVCARYVKDTPGGACVGRAGSHRSS